MTLRDPEKEVFTKIRNVGEGENPIARSGGSSHVHDLRSASSDNRFPKIDDSDCNRIHSFVTTDYCFYYSYEEKQLVAWREFCIILVKELKKRMCKCTSHDIHVLLIETILITTLTTTESINQSENYRKSREKLNSLM